MDEQNTPEPQAPELPPAPMEAEAPSPHRPIVVAILVSWLVVLGAIVWSTVYLGEKIDGVRNKLAEIGAAPGGEREEAPPAKVDVKQLVSADDPKRGPEDAKVTIVEFSDYECPFCERFVRDTMPVLLKEYGDKVQFVFKDFPLPMHPNAPKAAEAAHCAGDQGKYWEYHDKLFENRRQMSEPSLKNHARTLGLNTSKFDECLDSGKYTKKVRDNLQLGRKAQVNGTPTFFINGERLVGAQPFEAFKEKIDEELAK